MQTSLFDLENRYAGLSEAGDPLERLNAVIDWEIFRPILARIDAKERKPAAGRKPTCRVLMSSCLFCSACTTCPTNGCNTRSAAGSPSCVFSESNHRHKDFQYQCRNWHLHLEQPHQG